MYKARDLRLQRFVALKLLPVDQTVDDRRRRFAHEAKAAHTACERSTRLTKPQSKRCPARAIPSSLVGYCLYATSICAAFSNWRSPGSAYFQVSGQRNDGYRLDLETESRLWSPGSPLRRVPSRRTDDTLHISWPKRDWVYVPAQYDSSNLRR